VVDRAVAEAGGPHRSEGAVEVALADSRGGHRPEGLEEPVHADVAVVDDRRVSAALLLRVLPVCSEDVVERIGGTGRARRRDRTRRCARAVNAPRRPDRRRPDQIDLAKPDFPVRPLGFEPRTCGLRVHCSAVELEARVGMGWLTGFEPATFGTTSRRSNQLSYSHHGGGTIVAHPRRYPPTRCACRWQRARASASLRVLPSRGPRRICS
jgi:hypothetical protein